MSAHNGRSRFHVAHHPLVGDYFEIGSTDCYSDMVCVIAVVRGQVGYKLFGGGVFAWKTDDQWKAFVSDAQHFKLIRGGDSDLPF